MENHQFYVVILFAFYRFCTDEVKKTDQVITFYRMELLGYCFKGYCGIIWPKKEIQNIHKKRTM